MLLTKIEGLHLSGTELRDVGTLARRFIANE